MCFVYVFVLSLCVCVCPHLYVDEEVLTIILNAKVSLRVISRNKGAVMFNFNWRGMFVQVPALCISTSQATFCNRWQVRRTRSDVRVRTTLSHTYLFGHDMTIGESINLTLNCLSVYRGFCCVCVAQRCSRSRPENFRLVQGEVLLPMLPARKQCIYCTLRLPHSLKFEYASPAPRGTEMQISIQMR